MGKKYMEGDSRSFGKKSDIRDPARLSDRAHPVCVVHQRSSVAPFAEETNVFREIQSAKTGRSCSKTLMNC